jgi:hypothetical protein
MQREQSDEPSQTGEAEAAASAAMPAAASEDTPEIRTGSPFAVDPPETPPAAADESPELWEDGVLTYTALGAILASSVVTLFAAAALWWFPGGGIVVAALGCGLALFGLYSPRRLTSGCLLAIHLGLFFASYLQFLG